MGQYYRIINLDKKQFLHPHAFGNGMKLMELATSSCGILGGLAILLADGNGRGGGDLYVSGPVSELGPLADHIAVVNTYTIRDQPYESRAPKIVGSWKGDRIVIMGDYADEGTFGFPEGEKAYGAEDFTDISEDVIEGLCEDPYMLECLAEDGAMGWSSDFQRIMNKLADKHPHIQAALTAALAEAEKQKSSTTP